MKELKCPNCRHVFQVDEDLFESLASQVRNAAFEDEISRRSDEISRRMELELQNKIKDVENSFSRKLNEKDLIIARRDSDLDLTRQRLEALTREKDAAAD